MNPIDLEKMNKLPEAERYFDLNILWYFANRWVIRVLYPLPVTANQITVVTLVMGLIAVGCFLVPSYSGLLWGGIFFYAKIFFDNVDGNLARVRGETSRVGRFLDSITDFVVTVLVYLALTFHLVRETGEAGLWLLGFFALLSASVQCSYFVFYLVSHTSRVGAYSRNRVDESVSAKDREDLESGTLGTTELCLQRMHVFFYGWQDRLIESVDRVSRKYAGVRQDEAHSSQWMADKLFLTLSSPLCLCTNNMLVVLFALLDQVQWGLIAVALFMNIYLVGLQGWKVMRFRRMTA